MSRLTQSRYNYERVKLSDNPELIEGKCGGGCGNKMSELYWVWVSNVNGHKVCTPCYATSINANIRNRGKMTRRRISGPIRNPAFDFSERFDFDGVLPQCEKCVKECKVPDKPNVTKFYCADKEIK